MRKVMTLKTLDELNLSARTKTLLMRKFPTLDEEALFKGKYSLLNEIVWEGRKTAFLNANYSKKAKWCAKSMLALVEALDKAGFIRHDINEASFSVGRLYRLIFPVLDASIMPACLDDLCEVRDESVYTDFRTGNERYESFQNPSDELIQEIKLALSKRLNANEYVVLVRRCGISHAKPDNLEQVARHLRVTKERVRQIEAKALRKLQVKNELPPIVKESGREAVIDTIVEELDLLKQHPVNKRVAELERTLKDISKGPFIESSARAAKALAYYGSGITSASTIDELDLGIRAFNCLQRAGIRTVMDIIKMPQEDWGTKVRNLGPKSAEEIQQKMRSLGYTEFKIVL